MTFLYLHPANHTPRRSKGKSIPLPYDKIEKEKNQKAWDSNVYQQKHCSTTEFMCVCVWGGVMETMRLLSCPGETVWTEISHAQSLSAHVDAAEVVVVDRHCGLCKSFFFFKCHLSTVHRNTFLWVNLFISLKIIWCFPMPWFQGIGEQRNKCPYCLGRWGPACEDSDINKVLWGTGTDAGWI